MSPPGLTGNLGVSFFVRDLVTVVEGTIRVYNVVCVVGPVLYVS